MFYLYGLKKNISQFVINQAKQYDAIYCGELGKLFVEKVPFDEFIIALKTEQPLFDILLQKCSEEEIIS